MNIPGFLKVGDKVAIVATAKRLESDLSLGIETLEKWGLQVEVGKHVNNQFGYFAGTDMEKVEDLQSALDNPLIKAIIFARGGYGTARILDKLNFSGFLKNPKWLVGFSDLTSILLHTAAIEIPSIHGPVGITIGNDNLSDTSLKDMLFGDLDFQYPLIRSRFTREGECTGKIVGGNLSLIYESIGATNEIETEGNILFLEEVGEAKYSIDRMLNKLDRCGKLEGLSGVIIGSFSKISDGQSYFKETTEEILSQYFEDLNIPIAMGLEAGHEQHNYSLSIGRDCEIKVASDSLKIHYFK